VGPKNQDSEGLFWKQALVPAQGLVEEKVLAED
jgi:hypothetical protein